MTKKQAEAKGWTIKKKNGVGGSAFKGNIKVGSWRMGTLYGMIESLENGEELILGGMVTKLGQEPYKKVWAKA